MDTCTDKKHTGRVSKGAGEGEEGEEAEGDEEDGVEGNQSLRQGKVFLAISRSGLNSRDIKKEGFAPTKRCF